MARDGHGPDDGCTSPAAQVVDIGDLPVALCATTPAARVAMAAIGRHLDATAEEPRLTITCGSRRQPTPDRPADRADGPVELWHEGDDLLLLHDGATSGRVTARRAEWGGDGGSLPLAYHQLFPFTIAHLLAASGRFVVHGAAVQREGRAILVLGASGSGKSTLTVAALRHGWAALSDDLVVVRQGRDGPEIRGIPRPLSAPAELDAAAPRTPSGHSGRTSTSDRPDRRGVEVTRRNRREVEVPQWDRAWRPVTSILVADHGQTERSELTPLAREELLRWLLFSFFARDDPPRLRRYVPIAAALSGRRGYRLEHGTTPGRRLRQAAELLELASLDKLAPDGWPRRYGLMTEV